MRLLDNDELALRWGEIEPKVKVALDRGQGESTTYDLFLECLNNVSQCWMHKDAVAITRIITFNQYKQLQIVTTASDDWFSHGFKCLKILEDFAKDIGCRNISLWGRPGWKRVLKDYEEPYTILIKEL
jgi:hypothetical protein